jgi:hypothetical protein
MRFLNKLERLTLTSGIWNYIYRSHKYIKELFLKHKKRENVRLVKSAKCSTKVMCQLIKHTGKLSISN